MLKMFTLMAGVDTEITYDNDPILAEAASNEEFVDEYILDECSQSDLYDMWMDCYSDEDSVEITRALELDSLSAAH